MTPTARPHVLVARLDNAGDVLLSGPAVRAAAAHGCVTYLAGPGGAEAAGLLPGVDRVVVFDAPWVGYTPIATDSAAVTELVAELAALALDAALVLTSFHQSPLPLALLLRLAGVARIAAVSEDYPGSLLDARLRYDPALHEVDQALAVAAALGFALPAGDAGHLAVRRRAGFLDVGPARPYVVVHPGASVAARAMPEGLAVTAAAALAGRGWDVVVSGGPGEVARAGRIVAAADACRTATAEDHGADGGAGRVHDAAGALDLAGLAELLAGASVLVTGNTGPAHLAAAVGTPVVELFAPVVDPLRWRPYGVPAALLGDLGISCAGCRARTCPFVGQPCVGGVTADDVVSALEQLVGPAPRPTAPLEVAP